MALGHIVCCLTSRCLILPAAPVSSYPVLIMKKAFLILHFCILLAGITGVLGKAIVLNEIYLTWYRMLFSGVILLAVVGLLHKKGKKKRPPPAVLLKIAVIGFVLGLHWICFYGSIKYATVSIGVVCFCLTSFFTALLAPLLNRRQLSIREILVSLLTLLGIILLFSLDTRYRTGIILGTISALLIALVTIWNERLVKNHDAVMVTTIEMLGGALGIGLLLPFVQHFYFTTYWLPNGKDLVLLIVLASLCTVLMYVLLNRVLRSISAFTVNLSFNLEPVYAILIAMVFFEEHREWNFSFYLGLLLILSSLMLQMVNVWRQKK